MKMSNKIMTILTAILLISIAVSTISMVNSQVTFPPGTHIPTYAHINVAPNPIGVGQTVNVNFFLATVLEDSSGPVNMTVKITDPSGAVQTKGPYTGDTTGGTFFNFVPDKAGNWTFQMFYGGQVTGSAGMFGGGYAGLIEDPSISNIYTLTVQDEPVTETAWPITPLPTTYWETPVSAQNVQNWYSIMGPWLGLGSITFASTGAYNASSLCNPFTPSVLAGHILWTKTWGAGGVVGGDAGGTEDTGNYWSTRQYWPQYAPVILNGRMYSTYYPETTGYSAGIVCTDLYSGQTLFTINTTSVLRCGFMPQWKTANMYGVIGPYLITTGSIPAAETGGIKYNVAPGSTQYNFYSAQTGQYVLSIVNGSSLTMKVDATGNLIGYYLDSTPGQKFTYGPAAAFGGQPVTGNFNVTSATKPYLVCVNFSMALGNAWGWSPSVNTAIDFKYGVMWGQAIPTDIGGAAIVPTLAIDSINPLTGNAVILTAGYVHMQGGGDEQSGWLVTAAMDDTTGALLMCKNFTYPTFQALLPFTRTQSTNIDGIRCITNEVNNAVDAFNVRTGEKVWSSTLKSDSGATNVYNIFGYKGAGANGLFIVFGLGGDIWAYNAKTGAELWYTNTTKLVGDPGIETPYDVWPLWVFSPQAFTKDVGYFGIGHEYNPPLFHGAQIIAVNLTDGTLVWSQLGTYIRSIAIANGVLLGQNAYDNQIYAFAKGPTSVTVDAPSVGVNTATPIRITGTVTDISAGTSQSEVAKNYPSGVPCVSDASMSHFMEHVYQDQPMPNDVTGVPITLAVVDSNGNYREIGQTTSTASGTFGFTWTPDISGDYTLYASFSGSNSYWPASAETSLYAGEAPTPAPTTAVTQPVDNTMTIVGIGIAIIVVVLIVGAVIVMMLRKHP